LFSDHCGNTQWNQYTEELSYLYPNWNILIDMVIKMANQLVEFYGFTIQKWSSQLVISAKTLFWTYWPSKRVLDALFVSSNSNKFWKFFSFIWEVSKFEKIFAKFWLCMSSLRSELLFFFSLKTGLGFFFYRKKEMKLHIFFLPFQASLSLFSYTLLLCLSWHW
jgi:hypothetical protein